jgi:phospholipid/cholesterol/gamma-HCH transport system permease protein
MDPATSPGSLAIDSPSPDSLLLRLVGDWRTREHLPSRAEAEQRLASAQGLRRVRFDGAGITEWDTGLLTFLAAIVRRCEERGIATDTDGLPEGVRELLKIAFAVPEKKDTGRRGAADPFLARVGKRAIGSWEGAREGLEFLGSAMIALGRFFTGRAQFRRSDFALFIQECGAQALGIVALISFLIGLIIGFVGAAQLALFGASIYVADLVAIAMARELAPIMAGIIMAGRTGAAFAAQLGTMTVNEEIDALKTFGVSPMEFLVLPRMLALILMMPLLCLYADLMGIAGGFLVGSGLYEITPSLYWEQTMNGLALRHVWIGVAKSVVFGILVALSGCLRGIQSGRSASAVGEAATSAVVTAIVLIIVSDGIFAVLLDVLGI